MYRARIDDTKLRSLLGKVSKSVRDLRQPLEGWGRLLVEQTEAQFRTQTDPDGAAWASLAPSTLREKARLGYPSDTLTRTGAMSKSFKVKAAAMDLQIISDSPYLKYHQRGTGRMPQRQVLVITTERQNEGIGYVRAYIKGKVKR